MLCVLGSTILFSGNMQTGSLTLNKNVYFYFSEIWYIGSQWIFLHCTLVPLSLNRFQLISVLCI